jgi:hypothetical protein
VANGFATYSILLNRERERSEGGLVPDVGRGREWVNACCSHPHAHILESERMGVFTVFCIFPRRSRKKNAIQIKSAAASEESSAAAWAMAQASWRTPSGIGWRQEGGGSALRKLWRRRDRRGSTIAVPGMTRGSGSPAIVCADATKETAAATVEVPMALWEAESRPSCTRTAKTESQKTALPSWAR